MIALDLNREEVELIHDALNTHEEEQLPGADDPEDVAAISKLDRLDEKLNDVHGPMS